MPYKVYIAQKKVVRKEKMTAKQKTFSETVAETFKTEFKSGGIVSPGPNDRFEATIKPESLVSTKDLSELNAKIEMVNSPRHYNMGKIEVFEFIADQKMDFFEGNVIKYVSRHKYKNGIEDLKKAEWYLQKLIKNLTDSKNDTENTISETTKKE